ncbi:hypothetical protein PGTUg99_026274 [Puccinia graminis f. sp. tritici]|uniref:Uncharacterized protein n=1 Tax=Puccinia graminis f. sp. tritici TaxID=56615 RepID=A0A5B0RLI6_PUCGR|nr:hypothetical protein PGTUg99_026274 [Puccinia graminis f. sp. tritici]
MEVEVLPPTVTKTKPSQIKKAYKQKVTTKTTASESTADTPRNPPTDLSSVQTLSTRHQCLSGDFAPLLHIKPKLFIIPNIESNNNEDSHQCKKRRNHPYNLRQRSEPRIDSRFKGNKPLDGAVVDGDSETSGNTSSSVQGEKQLLDESGVSKYSNTSANRSSSLQVLVKQQAPINSKCKGKKRLIEEPLAGDSETNSNTSIRSGIPVQIECSSDARPRKIPRNQLSKKKGNTSMGIYF